VTVLLFAACGGEGAGSDIDSSATDSPTATGGTPQAGVPSCWQAVGEAYKDASDQALLILRDGVARLIREQRAFARALNSDDTDGARRALGGFIDEAGSVTDASVAFDRARRMAITEQSECEGEGQGASAVAACWRDVAQAYAAAASQADRALDKPMALVLSGSRKSLRPATAAPSKASTGRTAPSRRALIVSFHRRAALPALRAQPAAKEIAASNEDRLKKELL
jgi:hypothetical protein